MDPIFCCADGARAEKTSLRSSRRYRITCNFTQWSKWDLWPAWVAVSFIQPVWYIQANGCNRCSFGWWLRTNLMFTVRSMASLLWVALHMKSCCIYCTSHSSWTLSSQHHWTFHNGSYQLRIQGGIKKSWEALTHTQALSSSQSMQAVYHYVDDLAYRRVIWSSDSIAQEILAFYLW